MAMKSKNRKAQTVARQNKGDVAGAPLPKVPPAFLAAVKLADEQVGVVLNLQNASENMRNLLESKVSLDYRVRKQLQVLLGVVEDLTYDMLYEFSAPISVDKQGRVRRPRLGSRMWYMPQGDSTT